MARILVIYPEYEKEGSGKLSGALYGVRWLWGVGGISQLVDCRRWQWREKKLKLGEILVIVSKQEWEGVNLPTSAKCDF